MIAQYIEVLKECNKGGTPSSIKADLNILADGSLKEIPAKMKTYGEPQLT